MEVKKKLRNIHILNVVSDNPILPLDSCTSGLVWSVSLLNRTPLKILATCLQS